MAQKFCIHNQLSLMDFCPGRFAGIKNYTANGKLKKLEPSNEESGGGIEVRIVRASLKMKP